jgi:hypothetical protein
MRSPEPSRGRWPPVAGDRRRGGRGNRQKNREQRELGEDERLWLGCGLEAIFKTRYGRTGQSTVPVRCTPDSAQ